MLVGVQSIDIVLEHHLGQSIIDPQSGVVSPFYETRCHSRDLPMAWRRFEYRRGLAIRCQPKSPAQREWKANQERCQKPFSCLHIEGHPAVAVALHVF